MSAQTYQVGAHFKALNEPDLMAPSKILEKFFSISTVPAALCNHLKGLADFPHIPCIVSHPNHPSRTIRFLQRQRLSGLCYHLLPQFNKSENPMGPLYLFGVLPVLEQRKFTLELFSLGPLSQPLEKKSKYHDDQSLRAS